MSRSGFAPSKSSSSHFGRGSSSSNHSSGSGWSHSNHHQTHSYPGASGGAGSGSVAYYADKKSEIGLLRDQLNKAVNDRNEDAKTEAIQKIIGLMTVGMDVSELFHSIIMIPHTQNILLKKMVFLYLSHYAKQNEQDALLVVNSVSKDTHDNSPMIRGMAIRWLSSLRTPSLVEHMMDPVKRGLIDLTAYVRRNAALACAKIYPLAPELIKDGAIINKLYELIRDKDAGVIVNALRALNEILADEGGVVVNQKIVSHLLGKFKEFNPWAQCFILQLLQNYSPQSDEELFAIMNVLDPFFNNTNSGLVLSTIHLFLTYTQTKAEIHEHVFLRLKNPLQTMMVGAGPELMYACLSHIILVNKRVPLLFTAEYKQFYIRYKDPLYLRLAKVKTLEAVATEINAKDIINELSAYVTGKEVELSMLAIRAIGRLAQRLPSTSALALELLVGFLELEQLQHVMAATLIVMKDMLRRFPDQAQDVIPRLAQSLDVVEETTAIAAIITMIGEYGEIIDESPYILEEVIKKWETQHPKVKAQLLVGTLKLFFKRPKEVKPILGKLFVCALEDVSNPDVHDRALFYYRLLSSDVNRCKQVLLSCKPVIGRGFVEEQDGAEVDKLFEEFNSLSVIYGEGSERFIKEEIEMEEETPTETETEAERYRREQEQFYEQQQEEANQQFSGGQTGLQLDSLAQLDAATFEKTWKVLSQGEPLQTTLGHVSPDLGQIETQFASHGVKTIAKGANGSTLRFFLYAQEVRNAALVLVELSINTSNQTVNALIKSENSAVLAQFKPYLLAVLQLL